jgi:putative ABC transport system permease protein
MSGGTQDKEIDVMVTGIYENYPSNSHFKPDYIVNVNAMRSVYKENFPLFMEGTRFGPFINFFENYITLKPGADAKTVKAITQSLKPLADQMVESDSMANAAGWKLVPFITPLSELHFDKKVQWESNNRAIKPI